MSDVTLVRLGGGQWSRYGFVCGRHKTKYLTYGETVKHLVAKHGMSEAAGKHLLDDLRAKGYASR